MAPAFSSYLATLLFPRYLGHLHPDDPFAELRSPGHWHCTKMAVVANGSGGDFLRRASMCHAVHANDRLCRLPDAVLVRIFEHVGELSKSAVCAISRVSKRYHKLADEVLYRTVNFATPEQHLILGQSLSRRPRRGSAIQEIKLAYPASQLSTMVSRTPINGSQDFYDEPLPMDSLSRSMSDMSNVRSMDIAVPEALSHGIGQLFNGPFDLACLTTCTLYYECAGDDYWDLQENIHIFAHPTLETLVIRHARLGDKPFDLPEHPEATSLKRLHLLECDISDDAIFDLLKFPEALEEFVMTQSADPQPDLEESSDSVRDYVIALDTQKDSLRTITIDHPLLMDRRALQLREFGRLRTLRLNWDHQLFGHSSKKPRLTGVGLPPELETLEFFNELGTDAEVTELFAGVLENLDVMARRLTHLIVVEGEDDAGNETRIPREIEDACRRREGLRLDIIGRFDTVEGEHSGCGDQEARAGTGSETGTSVDEQAVA